MKQQLFVYVGKKGLFGMKEKRTVLQPASLVDLQHESKKESSTWTSSQDVFTVKEGAYRWEESSQTFIEVKQA